MRSTLLFLALLVFAPILDAQRPADSARVVVSRREVRVTFPRDTATRWGWAVGEERAAYVWNLWTEAVTVTHSLQAGLWRGDEGRAYWFPSLRALARASGMTRCDNQGMVVVCAEPVKGAAKVIDGRIVLVLRDSALIADLFGLRPARVEVGFASPAGSWHDSVTVGYVDPPIAEPSDSLREWARRDRFLRAKSDNRVTRGIRASRGWGGAPDTTWLVLGDTAAFTTHEEHCSIDVCTSRGGVSAMDADWDIGDTTVLGRIPAQSDTSPTPRLGKARRGAPIVLPEVRVMAPGEPVAIRVVARRVGATTVAVRRLPPYPDTSAIAAPAPPTELARVVVVRPPARRVVIHPRPDTIRVGDGTRFFADVFDDAGGVLPHAPVELTDPAPAPNPTPTGSGDRWIDLPPGGPRRIVASFRGRADTITVFVADSVRR